MAVDGPLAVVENALAAISLDSGLAIVMMLLLWSLYDLDHYVITWSPYDHLITSLRLFSRSNNADQHQHTCGMCWKCWCVVLCDAEMSWISLVSSWILAVLEDIWIFWRSAINCWKRLKNWQSFFVASPGTQTPTSAMTPREGFDLGIVKIDHFLFMDYTQYVLIGAI